MTKVRSQSQKNKKPQTLALTENRIITITGAVEEKTIKEVAGAIAFMSQESSKPMGIRICSAGGCLDAGFGVADLISIAPIPIVTMAIGRAFSASAMIFLAGNMRAMYPNALIMTHYPSTEIQGIMSTPEIRTLSKRFKDDAKRIERYTIERTGLALAEVRRLMRNEVQMPPKLAIEKGFAHKVLPANTHW